VQYIQNTINKVEIEKIKNNHRGIDAEECRRVIIDMSESVCMHGHRNDLERCDTVWNGAKQNFH
jgi:hypothetical protein